VCGTAPKVFWIHQAYLSASVISLSVVKISGIYMGNANKSLEIPYSAMARKVEK